MATLKTTLCRTITGTELEVEFNVEVSYDYYRETGDNWNEPRIPAHCEIYGAIGTFRKQSEDIELTEKEKEKLNEECMREHALELSQED